MFATEIVNSDPFLDMPASTQVLYFHLGLHCDDDGFVYPKKVMRMINSGDDDLKLLLAKKFLLAFESGVFVQKHWKVNNYIRSDRKRPTSHREEMAQLSADSGGVYRLPTNRLPSGSISKEVSKEVEGVKPQKSENADELTTKEQHQRLEEIRESLSRAKKI